MSSNQHPYRLGQTGASGELEGYLGACGTFKHTDPAATSSLKAVLSEIDVEALWVKNESGGALTPGTIVVWDTGTTYGPGKAVGAAAVASTTVGVGVVDPWLPAAGVADNEHFWLVRRGVAQVKFTTGTTIAPGDVLALGASGRAIKYAAATSPTDAGERDRFGYSREAVDTAIASDTLFEAFVNFK